MRLDIRPDQQVLAGRGNTVVNQSTLERWKGQAQFHRLMRESGMFGQLERERKKRILRRIKRKLKRDAARADYYATHRQL